MALIHRTASVGSLEKSTGRAALSSVVLVDRGVTVIASGTGGANGCLDGARGTVLCLGGLGVWGVKVEGTGFKGFGKDGCSSSSLGSSVQSP